MPAKLPIVPTKVPAYQRFQTLADSGRPALQLLYKYRYLGELFKCIDTVCAIFHNWKKQITFRKLKPAVQRMARKNFYENRLAHINTFNRLLLAKAKDVHETTDNRRLGSILPLCKSSLQIF
ncbi:DNA replication factor Cdt1 [Culex quinquefasciatus]|uniref:DNA replication factor Cdt1 n=1 Tax=Culex quinquefasciatus TaxID=7176 RepID=B0WT18_CULQU|nr:DNA replication factor Cdt1 [Culex quinquefasciatus]|eukprot:XP_001870780.1 DNA replication factor Cdt1 [Culex quinquefasciatus]